MSKTLNNKTVVRGTVKKKVAPGCCGGKCSTAPKGKRRKPAVVAAPVRRTLLQRILALLGLD